jgi:hypothetical protein
VASLQKLRLRIVIDAASSFCALAMRAFNDKGELE